MRSREIWLIDLGHPIGVEAAFVRPGIVVGSPRMSGPLALVCPLTTTRRDYPWRVEIEPEGTNGLADVSYVQVEHVRSIAGARGFRRIGQVDSVAFQEIRRVLRILFDL